MVTSLVEKARQEWSDICADPDTAIRREKWAVWANTTGIELMAENERLVDALQVIATGEGCMNGMREELDAATLRKLARVALAMVEPETMPQPEQIEDATYEPADEGQS